ncbi:metal ABC transporter permease [Adhaeretor mobilis]|uniref:Manganese transport system membrane protein MntB n=1 Tax=Adhaeretor mobilis TaxID=1930276 RepID=A0A517MWZ4_9BACT|nr:metal ABC transporter permease [Adhaeretor mobilis]QDS99392.1 Manganese transport system membrane protein MntB [Adhaeretor mobilis]
MSTLLMASELWHADGLWIIAIGALTNTACALVGCFLVLRRMSMMGDALSHSVLAGLAVAFAMTQSYSIVPLFIGAIAAGLLTTFLTQTLHQYARVPSDASMGVVFTSMFALGVIIIKKFVTGVHFDIACVYEGALGLTPFFTREIAGREIPLAVLTIAPVLLLNIGVLSLLWKEWKVSSFDPALATTMGFSATLLHYVLMALVALTTVASFEAVGSILVVAMLIVPAATAHQLSDRLAPMVIVAAAVAVLSSFLGYVIAEYRNTNYAAMMTVVAGALYALAVVFSPRHGLLTTLWKNIQLSLRVVKEDLLAMLYRVEELEAAQPLTPAAAREALGGGWLPLVAAKMLQRRGRIRLENNAVQLTKKGRTAARKLVRSHRLWETYLVEYLGLPLDHIHEPAHRVEHFIDERIRGKLEEELDASAGDPHGREIPE